MVGDAPWCFFYASDKSDGNLPENLANVGFIVRDFAADLGGTALSTPHLNLIRTFNSKESQMACELGLPYDPTLWKPKEQFTIQKIPLTDRKSSTVADLVSSGSMSLVMTVEQWGKTSTDVSVVIMK